MTIEDYLFQVDSLVFEPVDDRTWSAILYEGLPSERAAPRRSDWAMSVLRISDEDARDLRALATDAIERFNLFDIRLKKKYGGLLIDLIDYENGVVGIVKVETRLRHCRSKRCSLPWFS